VLARLDVDDERLLAAVTESSHELES
jgi:hypothetical protein